MRAGPIFMKYQPQLWHNPLMGGGDRPVEILPMARSAPFRLLSSALVLTGVMVAPLGLALPAHADGGTAPRRVAAPAVQAPAETRISLDMAVPLRLAAPASGVVVGNPSVVGVSIQSDQLLFLTGRSYGSTNLIVVDAEGRTIFQTRIVVIPDETQAVMVLRGTEQSRLECTPVCRPRPDIGDAAEGFGQVNSQISSRQGQAASNAPR